MGKRKEWKEIKERWIGKKEKNGKYVIYFSTSIYTLNKKCFWNIPKRLQRANTVFSEKWRGVGGGVYIFTKLETYINDICFYFHHSCIRVRMLYSCIFYFSLFLQMSIFKNALFTYTYTFLKFSTRKMNWKYRLR